MTNEQSIAVAINHLHEVVDAVVDKMVNAALKDAPSPAPGNEADYEALRVTLTNITVSHMVAAVDAQHPDLMRERAVRFTTEHGRT